MLDLPNLITFDIERRDRAESSSW